jgi:hypothetical protein
MGQVKKFPEGLGFQGRNETRRERWIEQEWRNTMEVPRRSALPRRRGLSKAEKLAIVLAFGGSALLMLAGLGMVLRWLVGVAFA